MPPKRLHRAALRLEAILDARRRAGAGVVTIAPYRSYGRSGELIVRGRVLAEKLITRARSAEPMWRSVLNAYRRFESDEIAGAMVRASWAGSRIEGVTNAEGYFSLAMPTTVEGENLWREVEVELAGSPVRAVAHVMVPPKDASLVIVSDIDDTIVQTGAASLRTMVTTVMLNNAAMRVAFEGVADLYQRLHAGKNPIFYVSSSPWNLYDLLCDYMDLNAIPAGPMFLQDWGLDDETFVHAEHATHKVRAIQKLLDYYPDLPFLLIGDSGQHDPEIYLEVARANPGRIVASVIRDVSLAVRDRAVVAIADESGTAGVPMLYVADSAAALDALRGIELVEVR